jgi:hypothetical protein
MWSQCAIKEEKIALIKESIKTNCFGSLKRLAMESVNDLFQMFRDQGLIVPFTHLHLYEDS